MAAAPRAVLCAAVLAVALRASTSSAANESPFADFVEPGFPFIVTTVDARAPGLPERNVATRGIVLLLGDSTYAVFDPDLLRVSVAWRGDFLTLSTMAQVSYHEAGNKDNQIPRVLGQTILANGLYPGWTGESADFRDPRPAGPNPEDPGRGPLAAEQGRWNGLYVVGDRAVLWYSALGTEIHEQVGRAEADGEVGIVRTFRTGPVARPLTLAAAEVVGASASAVEGGIAAVFHGPARDSVTAVGVVDAPRGTRLEVVDDRHVTVRLPAGARPSSFRVVTWRGPAAKRAVFPRLLRSRARMVPFATGGPAHWPGETRTRGVVAPDTAAYVVDRLTLPIPNRWRRNVRVADVDFFRDGRAAVVTFDGDVWIVGGIGRDLESLEWKRFASGLYEPLSLAVVDDRVHVYARDGIVRLHDLNRDGEADLYENFSNLIVQPIESREFPLGIVAKRGGGFYVAKGGALSNGPRTAPAIMPGFRAGSRHSGSVLEVSPDGRAVRTVASGFREPVLGGDPGRGFLTASDQQGNFVPSTPIHRVRDGRYYGVPATAHREPLPEIEAPLVWIPHAVDQSGAGQAWVEGERMGFEGDALLHLSYGRPGVFRVFVDSASHGVQGAVVSLLDDYPAPLLRGRPSPADGQLYLAGFQIYGSRAREVSALSRLRYTGRPGTLPLSVRAGRQGVLLRFGAPLDPATATDPARYRVRRWNYRRSQEYGSGHYRRDATPGQEEPPVAASHLSRDGRSLLLVIPDMREVMQMEVAYGIRAADGREIGDTVYLSPRQPQEMDLAAAGFPGIDWEAAARRAADAAPRAVAAASARAGADLYRRIGCVACHSTDGSTAGKLGPSLRGLHGSRRALADGSTVLADDDYLRRSVREPASQVVQGFTPGMPSYLGVLGDAEIESLILFIRSLAGPGD